MQLIYYWNNINFSSLQIVDNIFLVIRNKLVYDKINEIIPAWSFLY